MWNDDILNSSVCNFHKIYPKQVLCFASVFWKLVCFAGFFLNNKTLQHLKLKESYKAILFLLVSFFSFFSNQMRISSISALTDLLSKLLRLLNTTTDLQLHPFSFFNQKFSVNKSKLKPCSPSLQRMGNSKIPQVQKYDGKSGMHVSYNMNKKNTYACVHIHSYVCIIYVCAFFSYTGKISLSHIWTSSLFMLEGIISAMQYLHELETERNQCYSELLSHHPG